MENYGLKVMSMGFLVDEETPMIWRGPMVMSALTQMLRDVDWGELDVLVVDMPPGTGDAQLTMAQQVPLAGAVIVSTPQDLALIDARKGLDMFKKVDVPLLGIVENMSYFIAPDTGKRYDIFGHGGARKEAERLGVTFLGEVPLEMGIRESSDAGTPVTVSKPDGAEAKIYRDIAAKVWDAPAGREGRCRSGRAEHRVRIGQGSSYSDAGQECRQVGDRLEHHVGHRRQRFPRAGARQHGDRQRAAGAWPSPGRGGCRRPWRSPTA